MNSFIPPPSEILLLPTSTGVEVITINNIVRIEAVSNYSKLFFASNCAVTISRNTLVVAKVLKWFDALLADKGFVRIHRSHLVNLSYVNSYNRSRHKIILQNQEQIVIPRRKRIDFAKTLAIEPTLRNMYDGLN
jgi:two-component system, LytTR family, response regulator